MKKWAIFVVLPILLVIALVASPVLAKDPEPPQKGLLWETIASLQEQIDTGLASLAQQLNEGLEALQGQIDSIQARLDDFEEKDPLFSEMDTEAELEAQIGGDNILTKWENVSLLNNDKGYITKSTIYSETIREESGLVIPGVNWCDGFKYEVPSNCTAISASGRVLYRKLDGTYGVAEYPDWNIVPYVKKDEVRYGVTIYMWNDGLQWGTPCTHFVYEFTYLYVMSPN